MDVLFDLTKRVREGKHFWDRSGNSITEDGESTFGRANYHLFRDGYGTEGEGEDGRK